MLAYAIDNRHAPEYSLSIALTHRLYRVVYPERQDALVPSHHWSLLSRFGGSLSQERYFESMGRASYVEHGEIELPIFKTYGTMIEEKVCFAGNVGNV